MGDDRETPIVCTGCHAPVRGDQAKCAGCGRVFSPHQIGTQHRRSSGSLDFGRSLQISMTQLAELVSTIGSVEAQATASRIWRLAEELDGWPNAVTEQKNKLVEQIKQLRERANVLLKEHDERIG